jgi:succinyl-CoA synthetase beta subunit
LRLLEHELKPMLSARGVPVPDGALASDTRARNALVERHSGVVVKSLSGDNDRASEGHVLIVDRDEVGEALEASASWGHQVWVEEAVPHTEEFFLGIIWPGERDEPTLLVGPGGSGIEQRDPAELSQLLLSQLATERSWEIPLFAKWPQLEEIALRIGELFEELDAVAIELNPVVPDAHGRLIALDAKAFVDPYGSGASAGSSAGLSVGGDQALIEFVELSGQVGVLSLGAGLTRALIDWLEMIGSSAACFSDLIPAVLADAHLLLAGQDGPESERAVGWLCKWLAQRGVRTLLVNLVSGGTPIDALSRSVLKGIAVSGWSGDVIPFVGGNRAEQGAEVWRLAGFPPAATFAEALGRVAELS